MRNTHRYKNFLLTVLLIILAFNWMERMAVGVLLQDIKVDLGLSDTQLGLLSGIAFAAFYALMGIPIARWADRGNRITIITLTTAIWGAAVALCAAATSFLQLLLVRVVVAVGEAGCVPPAHSLIADTFTRAERPRAVARYMLGGPLAIIFGYLGAGWLNELYGWRVTFILLGLPGLVLAVLVWLTLREPRRAGRAMAASPATVGSPAMVDSDAAIQSSVKDVCVTLGKNAAFRHLLFCFSVWYFFGYGLMQWAPAFFIRSHGLTTGEIGIWFAFTSGLVSLGAVYVGGELAARFAADNEKLQLRGCAVAFIIIAVFSASTYLAPNHYLAMGAMALTCLGNMAQGPILAAVQTLVPSRMRAMSLAILYLFANLIGMGLGPLAAGALSDWLRPTYGEESLRYALVILSPGYFWAAWHLWRAGKTVARDTADLHSGQSDEEVVDGASAKRVSLQPH